MAGSIGAIVFSDRGLPVRSSSESAISLIDRSTPETTFVRLPFAAAEISKQAAQQRFGG